LLGIGIGSSKGEGKALASRLTQMRKERNDRAKAASAVTKSTPATPAGGSNPAGELTFSGLYDDSDDDEGMQLITPGDTATKSKSKNKKKKKKNNKR
jgi:hypothetical protein